MQELSFPLKIHVRKNGLRVIFVEHTHYGSRPTPDERSKQNDTRYFCNWIRATFPSLPTEFRNTKSCSSYRSRWEKAERHFVAYDLTPFEFMMIKLAFGFKTIKVRFTKQKVWHRNWYTNKRYWGEAYYTPGYFLRFNIFPTDEMLARMAKNPDKYRKLTRNRQK